MSKSQVTCEKEIQSELKILAIIHLVVSILWCLADLLGVISIFANPSSQETEDFLDAELDTEKEEEDLVKVLGWPLIGASILVLLLRIYLFHLISTGMKKRNYIRCLIWYIIYAVLEILNVIGVIYSAYFEKNIFDVVIWSMLAPLNIYLFLVGFIYLSELKRKVFGGTSTENPKPRNKEVV